MEKRIERLQQLEAQLQAPPPSRVGFLDAVLGGKKKLKGVAPDRLFAMTTAYVTMRDRPRHDERRLGRDRRSSRSPPPTSTRSSRTPRSCCTAPPRRPGSTLESADDEFGYRWLILRDPDFEDLVVSLNTISTELQGGGYGDRLLAAVFPFEEKGKRRLLHLQLQARRALPVRARPGREAARLRARAAAEGPARQGAPVRGGHVALVPAVGDPAVGHRLPTVVPGICRAANLRRNHHGGCQGLQSARRYAPRGHTVAATSGQQAVRRCQRVEGVPPWQRLLRDSRLRPSSRTRELGVHGALVERPALTAALIARQTDGDGRPRSSPRGCRHRPRGVLPRSRPGHASEPTCSTRCRTRAEAHAVGAPLRRPAAGRPRCARRSRPHRRATAQDGSRGVSTSYARLASFCLSDPGVLDGMVESSRLDELTGCLTTRAHAGELSRGDRSVRPLRPAASCGFIDARRIRRGDRRVADIYAPTRLWSRLRSALAAACAARTRLRSLRRDEFIAIRPRPARHAACSLAGRSTGSSRRRA